MRFLNEWKRWNELICLIKRGNKNNVKQRVYELFVNKDFLKSQNYLIVMDSIATCNSLYCFSCANLLILFRVIPQLINYL